MKYDKEFKEQALKLSDEIGVKKAAEKLGLKYHTLADWRKIRKHKQEALPVSNEADAATRIRQLEKELSELRLANEILKDALGFFAQDLKK